MRFFSIFCVHSGKHWKLIQSVDSTVLFVGESDWNEHHQHDFPYDYFPHKFTISRAITTHHTRSLLSSRSRTNFSLSDVTQFASDVEYKFRSSVSRIRNSVPCRSTWAVWRSCALSTTRWLICAYIYVTPSPRFSCLLARSTHTHAHTHRSNLTKLLLNFSNIFTYIHIHIPSKFFFGLGVFALAQHYIAHLSPAHFIKYNILFSR